MSLLGLFENKSSSSVSTSTTVAQSDNRTGASENAVAANQKGVAAKDSLVNTGNGTMNLTVTDGGALEKFGALGGQLIESANTIAAAGAQAQKDALAAVGEAGKVGKIDFNKFAVPLAIAGVGLFIFARR
jgi:hypothetical protein